MGGAGSAAWRGAAWRQMGWAGEGHTPGEAQTCALQAAAGKLVGVEGPGRRQARGGEHAGKRELALSEPTLACVAAPSANGSLPQRLISDARGAW